MTQEVRIQVQLTMEVDASYSKEEIERRVNEMLLESEGCFSRPDLELIRGEIIDIEEEAEIYGNE